MSHEHVHPIFRVILASIAPEIPAPDTGVETTNKEGPPQKSITTARMEPQTLEALRASIAKWEAIVAGTGEDLGPRNCALCQLFWYESDDCEGCPVAAHTGFANCDGTPYGDYTEAREASSREAADDAAKRMLAFLKSLCPENV